MRVYESGSNLREYKEKEIDLENMKINTKNLSAYICSKNIYNDFVMYENNKTISLGIGKEILIEVYPTKIDFYSKEERFNHEIGNLSNDLEKICKNIKIKSWRAYGIANFEFAYYTYYKKYLLEKERLLELFIPKIDIRINNSKILIRALSEKDIKILEDIIKDYSPYRLNESIDFNYIEKIKDQNSEKYKIEVAQAIDEIKSGKYQKVIISRKITLDRRIDMKKSYLYGRGRNTPARSYYLKLNDLEVIGFSPETIVETDGCGNVYTFPLAGTRSIGMDLLEKKKFKNELLTDSKEISEHAVSVKLAYNELRKICESESVSIVRFMDVLERGTVQHLASRVKGKLKNNMNEWDAFSALFPAVTASGIPKKESLEAIGRIEQEKRELYSGGVLIYDFDGSLDVALTLRSAYQNSKESWIRAGAGIVDLSNPERELEETKEKLSCVVNNLIFT